MGIRTDDILAVLDCLLAAPPELRRALRAELLARAVEAERYRRAEGRLHPEFGGGSLMAAAASLRQGARVPWDWAQPEARAEAIGLLQALGPASGTPPG
ncbi:hypothetical protein [Pseudoruegeria sp. SHC-113]|uniref:DUF7742 family protein n=1 Tax=Pseudoruegeria sp. SHC-113 TaxID=2855439 RepID=UPI0021BB03CE|nr:hypothetical protein [Pseudoruegeria sp. SHC-113]MCT8160131.1 hypothetical protein [Pseudoruegeria sp. SHC-113]